MKSRKEMGKSNFPKTENLTRTELFDELEMVFSNDEKMVLAILGGMKEIIDRDRVQAIVYLLKNLYDVSISWRFDLGRPPKSEELHYIMTRMELDYYGLGFKLIGSTSLTLDYETGMDQNVLYKLTGLGDEFVNYLCSAHKQINEAKNKAASFRQKIVKNGYMGNIDRYAGWVYIKENLIKTEPKPLTDFYCKELGYDKSKLVEFYKDLGLSVR